MAVSVYYFYAWTMAWWGIGAISTFGAVFFGCAVDLIVMLLIGGMHEDDLRHMPMLGGVLIRVFRKLGVFKTAEEAAK